MCVHANGVRRIHGEFDPKHHSVKDSIEFGWNGEIITAKLAQVAPHYVLYRQVAARPMEGEDGA